MGLFSSIGKFVGSAIKTAGDILPGPIGTVAGIAGGVLGGTSLLGGATRSGASTTLPTVSKAPNISYADRLTGASDSTTIKGILNNTVRYTPLAGAANAFSDLTGISIGQGYAAAPGYQGSPTALQGFTSDLMAVTFKQEARAPKGYRVHTVTDSTAPLIGLQPGAKVAVRLGSTAARILGVKRSKKPVLSVRDSEALRRAARAKKKVARISKGAGLHVYTSPRSTGSTKRR